MKGGREKRETECLLLPHRPRKVLLVVLQVGNHVPTEDVREGRVDVGDVQHQPLVPWCDGAVVPVGGVGVAGVLSCVRGRKGGREGGRKAEYISAKWHR